MNNNSSAIIYNVTIKVEIGIADEWLKWLKQEHIPEILKTNCFNDYKIVKLLDIDDSDGPTYAVQYFAESKSDYNRFVEIYAGKMIQRANEKWSGGFVEFRSVMEVVK